MRRRYESFGGQVGGSRFRSSPLVAPLVLATCLGCGGGGGGSSGGPGASGPPPPASLTLQTSNGAVLATWPEVAQAASYRLYWSTAPGVQPGADPSIALPSPPHVFTGLTADTQLYAVVASVDAAGTVGPVGVEQSVTVAPGGAQKYFPGWADVAPTTTLLFDYDPGKSVSQNGADLAAMMHSLAPGDRLEVGTGTYSIESAFHLNLAGTADAPIWIVAQAGASPVITRSDNSQNTVNLGTGGLTQYLCIRGIEITGGDIALRLYDCNNVWIDQCDIHHCAQNAIAANSVDVDSLYFTRNEVHDTNGTGEGFYIGGNFSNPVASNCVIALNHVYNTSGSQGDGIEVKQGSWGNWIAENTVHDTNYPCILVYGTDGNPVNVIERNICWNSGDNTMQVQGEAIVRNNVILSGANAFFSSDHQGTSRDLVVVSNTIVNTGTAARLTSWDGRPGMVFANNAVYSQAGTSMHFSGGSTGVDVTGNVVFGPVSGVFSGYTMGAGLSDFVGLSWDGMQQDATPSPTGALIGSADAVHAVLEDFTGSIRIPPYETGAVDD